MANAGRRETNENVKRTINISKEPDAAVKRLWDIKATRSATAFVEEVAERYITTVRRHMPELETVEWCLLFEALRPPWEATETGLTQMHTELARAVDIDRLDRKWETDGTKLKTFVRRLPYAGRLAIGEMSELYWTSEHDEDEFFNEIVAAQIEMFSSPQSAHGPRAATHRMSPERTTRTRETNETPSGQNGGTPAETSPGEEAGHGAETTTPAGNGASSQRQGETEAEGAGSPGTSRAPEI